MRVLPVLSDSAQVVDAVARALELSVSLHSQLDIDVYRLSRAGNGPDLVARAFGPAVERAAVDAAAHVLQRLAGSPFPAERCPNNAPVLPMGNGAHLLITEVVQPVAASGPGFVLAWCAGLLATLATRSADSLPAGGGWHRLGATPAQEVQEALRLGGQVGPRIAEPMDALAEADDGIGLPEALIHPDLTPANAVPQGERPPVIIDWVGVGRGPRIWPLAFLLFAAGPRAAARLMDRYTRRVPLTDEERQRLPEMMIARPLCLNLWSVAFERMTAEQAVIRCRTHRARVAAIAAALR